MQNYLKHVWICITLLTHWGWDNMATIFQTIFSIAFSWMKMYVLQLKFHWSLFLRVQLTIFQHWLGWWLGANQVTSHSLNQWWLVCWCIYTSLSLNELTTFYSHSEISQDWWNGKGCNQNTYWIIYTMHTDHSIVGLCNDSISITVSLHRETYFAVQRFLIFF